MKAVQLLKNNLDLQIVFVAVLFFASACLGYFLAFKEMNALPAWPPVGVAVGALVLLGRQVWPGVTIGALLANLLAYWNQTEASISTIVIVSSTIAIIGTIEALLGNLLIKKWIGNAYPFTGTKDTFRFFAVAFAISLFGGIATSVVLLLNNLVDGEQMFTTSLFASVGKLVGMLLFTPLMLAVVRKRSTNFTKTDFIELAIFLLSAALIIFVLRMDYFHATFERALPFLIIPIILWMAFKYDLLVPMGSVLLLSVTSIYFTIQQTGPFLLDNPEHSILLLQIIIAVISSSSIVVAATVKEKNDFQHQLKDFNGTLEQKIEERTRALNEEILSRKLTEQKLVQTNLELSKRNTELDNFVYSVSHDLRAPIASVLGLTTLAKKDDGPMKDQYLDMITKSAQQQDHFIREILDQSRNSRLEVKREEVSFENVIDETFNQLKYATPNGQLVTKIVNVQQNKPFVTDRWRVKVMLNNIISNSIRYRNGKDPVIEVNVQVDDALASVEIKDNGRGISKEHLANVCKMFYRATDEGAGSGLGLYIVKETIEKLNGSLNIDSEIGKGTKVRFQIPALVS